MGACWNVCKGAKSYLSLSSPSFFFSSFILPSPSSFSLHPVLSSLP